MANQPINTRDMLPTGTALDYNTGYQIAPPRPMTPEESTWQQQHAEFMANGPDLSRYGPNAQQPQQPPPDQGQPPAGGGAPPPAGGGGQEPPPTNVGSGGSGTGQPPGGGNNAGVKQPGEQYIHSASTAQRKPTTRDTINEMLGRGPRRPNPPLSPTLVSEAPRRRVNPFDKWAGNMFGTTSEDMSSEQYLNKLDQYYREAARAK